MIENIICFTHSYTLADANLIIVLLILVVIVLVVMGATAYVITGLSVSETSSSGAFSRHWTTTVPS